MTIFLGISLVVTFVSYILMYIDYGIKSIKKKPFWELLLFFDILFYAIPIVNSLWFFLCFIVIDSNISLKIKELNAVRKCPHCRVSSRNWQILITDGEETCPVCEAEYGHHVKKMNPDDRYPFAQKLKGIHLIVRLFHEAKKNRSYERINSKKNRSYEQINSKINKKKKQINEAILYDKELEAYNKVQLRKLKKYEEKKNLILAELDD